MNCQEDWAREVSNKGLRLKLKRSLNRFEARASCHPVALWVVLIIIVAFWAAAAVLLVKHNAEWIDSRPAVSTKLA